MANTFEIESNDSKATANTGTLGTSISGQLQSNIDVDYFKFTASSATTLNLGFVSPTSSSSSLFNISIYDSLSATTPLYTNITGSSFNTLMWSAPAGTYYIAVSSADVYNSGQYSLTVTSGTFNNAIAEKEGNDSVLTANAAFTGRSIVGQLNSPTDKDHFSFVISQTGEYTIDFDAPTSSASNIFRIRIYGADGLEKYTYQTGGDQSYTFSVNAAGTYHVAIEAADVLDTHAYKFTLNKSGISSTILNGNDEFDDTLLGTSGADSIYGKSGNDILLGKSGNDLLDGGQGNDELVGGVGDDSYFIDSLDDSVIEYASGGKDLVVSTINVAGLFSEVEDLQLTGAATRGVGNTLDNYITGNNLNNVLTGLAGQDTLDGGAGNDTMTGGSGNDTYFVDSKTDKVVEAANAGYDKIITKISLSSVVANIEEIVLANDATYVVGNTIANKIVGNDGNNSLSGLAGNDTLDGGGGADALNGGLGSDTLTGGLGVDAFVFNTTLSATTNVDTITDFEVNTDQMLLSRKIFTKFTIGDLDLAYFSQADSDPAASTTHASILYNTTSGDLYYDKDGTGSAVAVKFAHLDGVASLSASDFVII